MSLWVGMVHQKTSKQQHFPGQQALFSAGRLTHEGKAPESLGNKALKHWLESQGPSASAVN